MWHAVPELCKDLVNTRTNRIRGLWLRLHILHEILARILHSGNMHVHLTLRAGGCLVETEALNPGSSVEKKVAVPKGSPTGAHAQVYIQRLSHAS